MGPLGFREAAEFWGVAADPELSFRLHALVGGAAEDKDRCGGAGPRSRADLDRWVRRWLLSPDSPVRGEGGQMMRTGETAAAPELAALVDAICAGNARPGRIGAALGWPSGQVERVLAELARRGVVERLADPLGGEPACVIVAPMVRLHRLVIAPAATVLAAGQAERLWSDSQPAVAARIYQPHFASLARQWCLRHADSATIGGAARGARPVALGCRQHGVDHELEALVVADPVATGRVLAIGATQAPSATGPASGADAASVTGDPADSPTDVSQLSWLEHLRGLLPADRVGSPPRLLLFSRSGFAAGLAAEAADRPDVELVGVERIYRGA
jgi:hypothetical protein